MQPRAPWLLLAGDFVCLSLFVVLGLRSHGELAQASALSRFLINAGPLALAWTGAALALGAWRPDVRLAPRSFLGRSLAAWLIAAPLAVLLRALWLRSAIIAVPFLLVTLALGGALLLVWRTAYLWLSRR